MVQGLKRWYTKTSQFTKIKNIKVKVAERDCGYKKYIESLNKKGDKNGKEKF